MIRLAYMSILISAILNSQSAIADTRIFILAGQSNMVGGGNNPPINYRNQSDVYFCQWLNEDQPTEWNNLSCRNAGGFGPELSFGRSLADNFPDDNIAIIKVAYNGTSLYADWRPNATRGRHLYERMLSFAQTRIEELVLITGQKCIVEGLVWVQGENDSTAVTGNPHPDYKAQAYAERLGELITTFRMDFNSNAVIYIGKIYPLADQYVYKDIVRANMDLVANTYYDVYTVDLMGLPLKPDEIHLNTQGCLLLGNMFASSVITLENSR